MSIKKEEDETSVQFSPISDQSSDEEDKKMDIKSEKKKSISPQHQLFLSNESKTDEAQSKFTVLKECTYANKSIGVSSQEETITCDCHEQWSSKLGKNLACGEDSDCINRITSVECVNEFCTCGENCQNQRFQKKEYAQVSVIQTEKKGYGLRADEDIESNSFIYEYIGEVIDEAHFRKRMMTYDQKKFKHFYFMMLQKGEFIDATVRGCLARFCNHSCNPNAYVDKWVVGKKLKMGIFSKRKIVKGEEITFDYNVDRYGADAQPCYCGEPNCIGVLGGKTQTDSALILPDGIADALGVTHDQEKEWFKHNKKLKAKQNEDSNVNEAFVNSLAVTELTENDVSKVMSSLMRSQDLCITKKLIERIHLTEDPNLQTRVIRIHGYQTLSTIIKEYTEKDNELIIQILEVLLKWPKITRNKISSSKIEDVVKELPNNSTNETIKSLSEELLKAWSALEMAYRIPKKQPKEKSSTSSDNDYVTRSRSNERKQENVPGKVFKGESLMDGWEWALDPSTNDPYFFNRDTGLTQWEKPNPKPLPTGPKSHSSSKEIAHTGFNSNNSHSNSNSINSREEEERLREERSRREKEKEKELLKREKEQKDIEQIIKNAHELAEKKRTELETLKKEQEKKFKERHSYKAMKVKSAKSTPVISAQWTKAFALHAPNCIKKFEPEVGRDVIKQCAKDIVKILVEKELKRQPDTVPPKQLSDSKIKKIKEFSNGYMDKFMQKFREKSKRKHIEQKSKDSKRMKVDT